MGLAVGIDLGTTNTVVAAVREGVASPLADPQGFRLIPSVVSFHPSGTTLVGRPALDRRLIDPANTIYSVKRLIGRTWSTPEVQRAKATVPFELREGPNASCLAVARGQSYTLPEISAFVLRHAKAVAEAAVGEPVERAVITVPANFNDLQRAATKTAGRLVGLEVLRILNEPTAAALAYGPSGKAQERVAVYDLGGGTFDVTVLDLAGNVFEVIATAGDSALGGDDIDLLVADRMADDLLKKHRYDARSDGAAFGRVRMLAERLKVALSGAEEHTVTVDDLVPGDRGRSVRWTYRMTRPELEWASLALVERTFKVCQQAFEAAGTTAAELDRVILVGGATRMPMVARKVEQFFAKRPTVRINPDEVVSLGAAIQAALLDRAKKTAPGTAAHPTISEDSIVEALPHEDVHGRSDVDEVMPVVKGRKGAIANQAAAPEGAKAPSPGPGEFLPGGGGRALVFDTPQEPTTVVRAAPPEPLPPPPQPAAQHRVEEVEAPAPLVAPTVPGAARPPVRARQATVRYELELAERKFAPRPAPSLPSASATLAATPAAPPVEAVETLEEDLPLASELSTPPESDAEEAVPLSLPPEPAPEATFAPSFPPLPVASPVLDIPTPVHSFQPATVPAFTPMMRHPREAYGEPAPAFAPAPAPAPAPAARPLPPRPAPLLIDVTPLSLGVETAGGYCDVLIDANTPVPCDRTRTFTPARDGQTTVQVRVAQGTSLRFDENTCLGELELSGLNAALRGEQQIAVTFEIDADGILNVRARDVVTGRETTAHLQLLGAQQSPADLAAMQARQAAHPIAPLR